MKDRLLQLWELFCTATPATRITLVMSTLIVACVATAATWFAGQPDYIQLWSGLTAAEAADYKNALAQAGIPFRSSPPPENGIWVDSSAQAMAEAQVALGGYKPKTKGIQVTDGGAASAFLSARSRQQMADKREWQECELQLESLDFVERATVATSGSDHSAFGPDEDPTISVTLGLTHGVQLDPSQSRTVATLVRGRFNVPLENITVVDERGNLLHDGAENGNGMSKDELFNQKRRHDADSERRANRALELALGKGRAYVTVSSEWTYDEMESITESALPEASTPYYQSKQKSEMKNPAAPVGGPAGLSSNITQDFGNETAGIDANGGSGPTENRETTETRSIVGRSTEHRMVRTPRITRLSIALVSDESVSTDLASLENMVKAAVGYEKTRGDQFESFSTSLASIERDEEGNPLPPVEPEPIELPNRYLELAIEHGVELVAALGFLFVLFKSLKGASRARSTAGGGENGGDGSGGGNSAPGVLETNVISAGGVATGKKMVIPSPHLLDEEQLAQIDPEILARAQVEELVRSDPERVTDILKQWATATERLVKA